MDASTPKMWLAGLALVVLGASGLVGCGTALRDPQGICSAMDDLLRGCGDNGVSTTCVSALADCDAAALETLNATVDCVENAGCGSLPRCDQQYPMPLCAGD